MNLCESEERGERREERGERREERGERREERGERREEKGKRRMEIEERDSGTEILTLQFQTEIINKQTTNTSEWTTGWDNQI